jgi:hypothetical protein
VLLVSGGLLAGLGLAVPTIDQIGILRRAVRFLIAIESVKIKAHQYNLTNEQKSQLKEKEATEKATAESAFLKLYTAVWLPKMEDGRLEIDPVSVGGRSFQTTLNEKKQAMVHERVMELLMSIQPKVFDSLTPGKIITSFKLGEGEPPLLGVRTTELVDGFYSFLGFPRLISARVIQKAIVRGIQEGAFGYYNGTPPQLGDDGKYQVSLSKIVFEKAVPEDEIDLDLGFIIMPEAIPFPIISEICPTCGQHPCICKKPTVCAKCGKFPCICDVPPPVCPNCGQSPCICPGLKTRVCYKFGATRDQVFKAFPAIANLADKSDDGKVTIQIEATTADGYDPNWLRNAVDEPLDEADIEKL